jgi:hypothetical protein
MIYVFIVGSLMSALLTVGLYFLQNIIDGGKTVCSVWEQDC